MKLQKKFNGTLMKVFGKTPVGIMGETPAKCYRQNSKVKLVRDFRSNGGENLLEEFPGGTPAENP